MSKTPAFAEGEAAGARPPRRQRQRRATGCPEGPSRPAYSVLSENQAHKVVGVLFELQVQQLGTSVKFHASAGRQAGCDLAATGGRQT
jgi:hypothetical protein